MMHRDLLIDKIDMQFTEAYDVPAGRAKQLDWPFIKFQAGHFHMLVEPIMVADVLVQIGQQLFTSAYSHQMCA